MSQRLHVLKTYKMFVNGQFPRSESGRTIELRTPEGKLLAHASRASRKDLRDAVSAARAAFEGPGGWARRSPYNRGQILYRLAEMLEGKKQELEEAISALAPAGPANARPSKKPTKSAMRRPAALTPGLEAAACIDRLVVFAGWADKFAHVLGCQNPVAGPYYTFSVPEPRGVIGVIAPDAPALLPLVTLFGAAICSGNTVVALASHANPLPACVLAEAAATSDLPPGVLNILTGERDELLPHFASHGEIDAIHAADLPASHASTLRAGSETNLKRVATFDLTPAQWLDHAAAAAPDAIERAVEIKTIWHPIGA